MTSAGSVEEVAAVVAFLAQAAKRGKNWPLVEGEPEACHALRVEGGDVGAREPAAQPRERGAVHARDDTVTTTCA